ncbi:uncharacterized protein BBA_08799 [Beauveria bassiana ARSEF 2860]|uniref:HNH nuclease domain-containing protein n=1 Tax=Beauveria bassiana (strain ARSEF 2860) TaxID=655819 RepID=J4UGX9_BEAB2|nr:uncharacterized protein BBA_08799 [Beauveria bassiana ARSEF 2860]EJP62257.1 hypothetical protein BBA_08799 [Beauveria bassiana ARSEF 2860]
MSAAVTASQRSLGWNVNLTIGGGQQYPRTFAGLYQNPHTPTVTFADVCTELALCFEMPTAEHDSENLHGNDVPIGSNDHGHDNENNGNNQDNVVVETAWKNIAFALTETPDMAGQTDCPSWILQENFDRLVPALPSVSPRLRKTVTYHIVRHGLCRLPAGSSLQDHIRARCARHLPMPKRRRHPAYLPYNKVPSDSRLSIMPLRRKLKASRSQSPTKRTASGSTSPGKAPDEADAATDEYADMLAPASMSLDVDEAKRVINEFRAACIDRATCCAVSGRGEPWCPGQRIGPGVQACHIIPQQHYHIYPVERGNPTDSTAVENSTRRLYEAWQHTWSPDNGILLMKHLHDYFDARLFSIHPETLRVRAFVPFDGVNEYHGRKAQVTDNVDRNALRQHYEMCCIESMAAKQPNLERASSGASSISTPGANLGITSGAGTPFSRQTDLAMTPSSRHTPTQSALPTGDPLKSSRRIRDDGELWLEGGRSRKRRRRDDEDGFDGYITPYNNREFLADVNWELQKFKEPF